MTINRRSLSRALIALLAFLLAACASYGAGMIADTIPNLHSTTQEAAVIAVGTVVEVRPARWTTPNGQRPPLLVPGMQTPYTIIQPILLAVDQIVKGESLVSSEGRPPQRLLIGRWGGAVDQDSILVRPEITFSEGEQVVVFLQPEQYPPVPEGQPVTPGLPAWTVIEKFRVEDGQVYRVEHGQLVEPELVPGEGARPVSLPELIERMERILQEQE